MARSIIGQTESFQMIGTWTCDSGLSVLSRLLLHPALPGQQAPVARLDLGGALLLCQRRPLSPPHTRLASVHPGAKIHLFKIPSQ